MAPDVSTPVVVLRGARHGALGIVRSLGRLGVPVYVVESSRSAPAMNSRYTRGRVVWDPDEKPAQETIGLLQSMSQKLGAKPILIPTSDATAIFVARYAQELRPSFVFPLVDAELVVRLCSKRELFRLACRHSIPTPKTLFASRGEDLRQMGFPLLIKGDFGFEFQKRAGRRVILVRDAAALEKLMGDRAPWLQADCLVQEFIPGSVESSWMFNGYFDAEGKCLAGFTGRKLRQYPFDAGMTSLGECRWNPEVFDLACRLIRACGYRGMVDIDFCYDARDKSYKVVDVNPRIGATFRLFVDPAGLDIARAMYLDLTGQTIRAEQPVDGRKWVVEDCDLLSVFQLLRGSKLRVGDWLHSWSGVAEVGIFSVDDPIPSFFAGWANASRLARGLRSCVSEPLESHANAASRNVRKHAESGI